MNGWIDRIRLGDPVAKNELVAAAQSRLLLLARRMLARFPAVGRRVDAEDVMQDATMRLLRSLTAVRPADTRQFANLAAVHIRRELLDLARHYAVETRAVPAPLVDEPPAQDAGGSSADLWADLHIAVERLPAVEREVFSLTFYHGWTQARIAEMFGVDERTIRRRWESAKTALTAVLGGPPPSAD